ncbi:MAG: hypothetical protein ACOC1K_06230 [Nanoarchaeota archaeon]
MLKGKKIAQIMRKANQLLVEKIDRAIWYVSNSYCIFVLYDKEYMLFKEKYNSYKSTINIPEGRTKYKIQNGEIYDDTPKWNLVIPEIEEKNELKNTKLKYNKSEIYKLKNKSNMVLLRQEYTQFLEESWNIYASKTNGEFYSSPVVVKDDEFIKMVIMPIISNIGIKEEIEDNLGCKIIFNEKQGKTA